MKFFTMKFIAVFLLVLSTTFGFAQKIQWASKVVKCTSQYSKTDKSANQLLGKPNALPIGGNLPTAWAAKAKGTEEAPDPVTIRVGFDSPMRIQQVAIGESFNPGSIEKVMIYGTGGESQSIYEATPALAKEKARLLNIFFPATDFFVKEVELFLQPGKVEGWNMIDAIGVSDSKDSIKSKINLVPNLEFANQPENLGAEINSIYDELAPKISPDGKSLYFTRKFHPDNTGGFKDEDEVWFSELKNQYGKWTLASNVGKPINTVDNNFVQSITPDGNSLLLGNVYNKDGTLAPGVSLTWLTKEGWAFPEKQNIVDFYNLSNYANYYLSNDGMFLIMAIERKDSYGGIDLYVSFRKGDNRWSKPRNLGPTINTTMNDYSPFLAADGVSLYFSTSGLSGYGKEDIFVSNRLDSTWTNWSEPQNLGNVLNSPESDTKYNIPASGEFAYFSSTNNSFGKNDIFRIKLPSVIKPKPVVLVYGKVYNERNMKAVDCKITYEILDEEGGKEVGIARSNPTTGEYKIVLPAGKKYGFMAISDGYYSVTQNLDVSDVNEYLEIEKDLKLAPIEVGAVFTINNIFFDYAKATLKPESFSELNRLVKFMFSNPSIEIEIGGHTDNVGSDVTNQNLSEARAQAVADYLKNSGVNVARLKVVGYGETRPIAFNTDEEGRQMNRRVEMKILKK